MTTQDLKNNREMIIAAITAEVGEENVEAVMQQMLKGLDCCDTLEELISDAIYMALEFEDRPETSKLAALMSAFKEKNNVHYDAIEKDFVKNNN
jgi:hypothetical protein